MEPRETVDKTASGRKRLVIYDENATGRNGQSEDKIDIA